jgi:hypothetical protein
MAQHVAALLDDRFHVHPVLDGRMRKCVMLSRPPAMKTPSPHRDLHVAM